MEITRINNEIKENEKTIKAAAINIKKLITAKKGLLEIKSKQAHKNFDRAENNENTTATALKSLANICNKLDEALDGTDEHKADFSYQLREITETIKSLSK